MVENIKPEVIKKTQDLLMPYFKIPPLTEKLLKKPPFRFLHDIILSIIRETGFLDGLFSDEELNSDNIKDRSGKIRFLNKLIYVVESTTGNHLSIKTNKIIAGLEPTKTNELLQLIGTALQKQLNSTDAIIKYKIAFDTKHKKLHSVSQNLNLSNENPTNVKKILKTKVNILETSSKRNIDLQKLESFNNTDKRTEINTLHPKKDQEINSEIVHEAFATKSNTSSNPKLAQNRCIIELQKKKTNCNLSELNSKKPNIEDFNKIDLTSDDLKILTVNSMKSKKITDKKEIQKISEKKDIKNEIVRKLITSSLNNKNEDENLNVYEDSIKINQTMNNDIILDPSTHLLNTTSSSSRPAAPKLQAKMDDLLPVQDLIYVKKKQNYQNKSNLTSISHIEAKAFQISTGQNKLPTLYDQKIYYLDQDHGHLVAQILETQKDLTNSINFDLAPTTVKTNNDLILNIERTQLIKEIDSLRYNIQQLASASNPLGKLIDLIQENIEIMQKEYFFWIHQNSNFRKCFNIKKISVPTGQYAMLILQNRFTEKRNTVANLLNMIRATVFLQSISSDIVIITGHQIRQSNTGYQGFDTIVSVNWTIYFLQLLNHFYRKNNQNYIFKEF